MQKDLNKVINSVRKRTHTYTHREKFNIFSVSNSILSISSEFTLQSQAFTIIYNIYKYIIYKFLCKTSRSCQSYNNHANVEQSC